MSFTDLVDIPENINKNVSAAKQITMKTLLGNPRSTYDQSCKPVTNPALLKLIIVKKVDILKNLEGLKPAIESLEKVLADISKAEPEIYKVMGHVGMLCSRLVRGETASISNHSWGTAIDLTLEGKLDTRGDKKVQIGLVKIAPIFNIHGWYWGAGFRTEDAMHFEIADETIRKWHADGVFGTEIKELPKPMLTIGDRGEEVKLLQQKLKEKGANIEIDGVFTVATQSEIMAFQARNNLKPDGLVGEKTWAVLNAIVEAPKTPA